MFAANLLDVVAPMHVPTARLFRAPDIEVVLQPTLTVVAFEDSNPEMIRFDVRMAIVDALDGRSAFPWDSAPVELAPL